MPGNENVLPVPVFKKYLTLPVLSGKIKCDFCMNYHKCVAEGGVFVVFNLKT